MTKSLLANCFGAEKARPSRRSLERIGHPSISFSPVSLYLLRHR